MTKWSAESQEGGERAPLSKIMNNQFENVYLVKSLKYTLSINWMLFTFFLLVEIRNVDVLAGWLVIKAFLGVKRFILIISRSQWMNETNRPLMNWILLCVSVSGANQIRIGLVWFLVGPTYMHQMILYTVEIKYYLWNRMQNGNFQVLQYILCVMFICTSWTPW